MRIPVDYPTATEEHEIVARSARPVEEPERILSTQDVSDLQALARSIHIDPAVQDYAVRLVLSTRRPADHGLSDLAGLLAYGASPRASIGLVHAARALALLRGRSWVLPQDVYDIAYDVLNHRLVLSFDAVADGVSVDDVLVATLERVVAPRVDG
jgi:MoxR-like ATPase